MFIQKWRSFFGATPPRQDEFWRIYFEKLRTLDRRLNRHSPEDPKPKDPTIPERLAHYDQQDAGAFEMLYSAEQALINLADDAYIKAEAARRFAEAQERGLSKVGRLQDQFDAAETTQDRKEVLLGLVDELQIFYLRASLERTARVNANTRLNRFAFFLVVPTFFVLALMYSSIDLDWLLEASLSGPQAGPEAKQGAQVVPVDQRLVVLEYIAHFHLFAVMWFGVIGALFSRLISFRQTSANLSRDAIVTEFSRSAVWLRLVIGLVASIIMYLLLKSEILQGPLFPNWIGFQFVDGADLSSTVEGRFAVTVEAVDPEMIGPPAPVNGDVKVTGKVYEIQNAPLISRDFALLLVWSLLAGFSERLIPDRFSSLEDSVTKPKSSSLG